MLARSEWIFLSYPPYDDKRHQRTRHIVMTECNMLHRCYISSLLTAKNIVVSFICLLCLQSTVFKILMMRKVGSSEKTYLQCKSFHCRRPLPPLTVDVSCSVPHSRRPARYRSVPQCCMPSIGLRHLSDVSKHER